MTKNRNSVKFIPLRWLQSNLYVRNSTCHWMILVICGRTVLTLMNVDRSPVHCGRGHYRHPDSQKRSALLKFVSAHQTDKWNLFYLWALFTPLIMAGQVQVLHRLVMQPSWATTMENRIVRKMRRFNLISHQRKVQHRGENKMHCRKDKRIH